MFHADNAQRVYLQARTSTSPPTAPSPPTSSMGAGTIYTVVSNDTSATPAELQAATAPVPRDPPLGWVDCHPVGAGPLPAAPPRPTPGSPPWPPPSPGIGAPGERRPPHLRQGRGHRAVDGDPRPLHHRHPAAAGRGRRRRLLPVRHPARLLRADLDGHRRHAAEPRDPGRGRRWATCPGPYNPITDLYDIQAKDAHAWVQVWFPGYGWQNFDPTADVPLANPTPGSVLAASSGTPWPGCHGSPSCWWPSAAAVVWVCRRRLARRPATWAHQVAADLARGGARIGLGPGDPTRR